MVDVVAVTREMVDLKLHVASNQVPVAVRLRPNQTFVASSGQTLEGVPMASVVGYSMTE